MRISDWSSDVCSSDLESAPVLVAPRLHGPRITAVDVREKPDPAQIVRFRGEIGHIDRNLPVERHHQRMDRRDKRIHLLPVPSGLRLDQSGRKRQYLPPPPASTVAGPPIPFEQRIRG